MHFGVKMFVLALNSHKSVFPLREWDRHFGNNEFLLVSSHIRRTWSGQELEMSLNTRGTTPSLPGEEFCTRERKTYPFRPEMGSTAVTLFPVLSVRPPQPRLHDYENVNPYGHLDHPAPPRGPTRPEAANRGETE